MLQQFIFKSFRIINGLLLVLMASCELQISSFFIKFDQFSLRNCLRDLVNSVLKISPYLQSVLFSSSKSLSLRLLRQWWMKNQKAPSRKMVGFCTTDACREGVFDGLVRWPLFSIVLGGGSGEVVSASGVSGASLVHSGFISGF